MKMISSAELLNLKDSLLKENILLSRVLQRVRSHKYIVGGYFRDYISNHVQGRDVDIMVEISRQELQSILEIEGVVYTMNHFGGFKFTDCISVDIWSTQDNWAFKNGLVKTSKKHMKRAISRGCFFNFDALVMDLDDGSFEIGPYEVFLRTRSLDILQEENYYRESNPTALANIVRALWIKSQYRCSFSDRLERYMDYVLVEYGQNRAKYQMQIDEIKKTYIKYSACEDVWETILGYCNEKMNGVDCDGQLCFSIPKQEQYVQKSIEFVF